MNDSILIGMLLAFLGQALVNMGLVLQKRGASLLPAIESTSFRSNVKGFITSGSWSMGIIITVLGGLLNFLALSFAPLLVVQAFLAIGLALIPFFSKLLLNEDIEAREMTFVMITVLGISLLFYNLLTATLLTIDEQILLSRIATFDSLLFHLTFILIIIGAYLVTRNKKSGIGTFWGFISGSFAGYAQILTRPFAVFFFRDLLNGLKSHLFWSLMIMIIILQVSSIIMLQLGFQKAKTSSVAVPYNVIAFIIPFFGSVFLLQEWIFTNIRQPIGITIGIGLALVGVSQLARRASIIPVSDHHGTIESSN